MQSIEDELRAILSEDEIDKPACLLNAIISVFDCVSANVPSVARIFTMKTISEVECSQGHKSEINESLHLFQIPCSKSATQFMQDLLTKPLKLGVKCEEENCGQMFTKAS